MNESVVQQHIDSVSQQMKKLNMELSDLAPALKVLNTQQKEAIFKRLTLESVALLQSLHFFTK